MSHVWEEDFCVSFLSLLRICQFNVPVQDWRLLVWPTFQLINKIESFIIVSIGFISQQTAIDRYTVLEILPALETVELSDS